MSNSVCAHKKAGQLGVAEENRLFLSNSSEGLQMDTPLLRGPPESLAERKKRPGLRRGLEAWVLVDDWVREQILMHQKFTVR